MKAPYDFGLSQEDERTESAALGLPGGRVLSIASAGDMPLSLLALGAEHVTAIDISPGQIALAELKRASVLALPADDASRFLGFRAARSGERELWMRAVEPRLPAAVQTFWRQHRSAALGGAIRAGRFEQYIGVIRRLTSPLLRRRFDALCRADTLQAQAALFDELLDRPWLRRLFEVAFDPRVYAERGLDRRGLRHASPDQSPGVRFFARFRDMCVSTPASENHLLQLITLGEVIDARALPAYLTTEGADAVRARSDSLELRVASIFDAIVAAPLHTFDRFHLSNMPDWLSGAEFERLLSLIAERAARPARVVWRDLHGGSGAATVPSSRFHDDRAAGERLRGVDRFPLYSIHPAELVA